VAPKGLIVAEIAPEGQMPVDCHVGDIAVISSTLNAFAVKSGVPSLFFKIKPCENDAFKD